MKTTANYNLYLEDDDSTKFKDWREKMNGVTDSNMIKIDTALKGKAESGHTHSASDIGDLSSSGTAASAKKLATARTISLTGDVTGSASFDGSKDVSINVSSNSTLPDTGVTAGDYGAFLNGLCWMANNHEVSSSTATLTLTAKRGGTLRFAYGVGSEENFDYLKVTVGDTEVINTKSTSLKSPIGGIFTTDVSSGTSVVFSSIKDSSVFNDGDYCGFCNLSLGSTDTQFDPITPDNIDTYFTVSNGTYTFEPQWVFSTSHFTVDAKGRITKAQKIPPTILSMDQMKSLVGGSGSSHTHTASEVGALSTSGGTVSGDLTVTGTMLLKGSGNYGNSLKFGDGSYVYLKEDPDDVLTVYADKGLNLNTRQGFTVYVNGTDITSLGGGSSSSTHGYVTAGQKSGTTLGDCATAEGVSTTSSGYASHAEGVSTTASGPYSHAEGISSTVDSESAYAAHAEGGSTVASGGYSHAEGGSTVASGSYSHAEGGGSSVNYKTEASGVASHAEGRCTKADGNYSHAEGGGDNNAYPVTASGESSHAEGYNTTAKGKYSHAEGETTTASGVGCHAEGYKTEATNVYTHAEGYETKAKNGYAHTEGYTTEAWGIGSHAEGCHTEANGSYSHAEGYYTEASGISSHAEGEGISDDYKTVASGEASHAEGASTVASGAHSHAECDWTKSIGYSSHAEGSYTVAEGFYSHAEGLSTRANNLAVHAGGKYNKTTTGNLDSVSNTHDVFVLGNGTSDSNSYRSNCFRITYGGTVYSASSTMSTGADYAEYFEWLDGNPEHEDRVGHFVTMDGDKIRFANPGEYILGIVSGLPCMIGNGDEDWLGRWQHDEFGRFIKEYLAPVEITDEEGNVTQKKDEDGNLIEEVVDYETPSWRYKQNPDYDGSLEYIERKDRPEWDAVGMMGVLSVRDDGSCEVNGYCRVQDGGTAVKAEKYIPGESWRVIARVSDSVVKVVFR